MLQRVFKIDALKCPRCDSTMRLIAAIKDPDVARRILECLKLPARAPPLGAAAAAPEPPHRAGAQGQLIATLFEVIRLPVDANISWATGTKREAAKIEPQQVP